VGYYTWISGRPINNQLHRLSNPHIPEGGGTLKDDPFRAGTGGPRSSLGGRGGHGVVGGK